ncbi:MAG: hypothetical protein V1863_02980 [Candidatus Omnitrophota bacterium]
MNISPLTAIEFNTNTVRVCRSVQKKAGRLLTHCFSFEIPCLRKDASESLRQHIRQNGIKPQNVILALPRHAAMLRLLRLPSQDEKEIDAMVGLYVRRQGSYSKEGLMAYDYQLVGFDEGGYGLISVFYIQRHRLAEYLGVLEESGILPFCVTLSTQGLLNLAMAQCRTLGENKKICMAVLNLDHNSGDYNIFFNDRCVFSRVFQIPGIDSRQRREWIFRELKVSQELFRHATGGHFVCEDKIYLAGLTQDFGDQETYHSCRWPFADFHRQAQKNLSSSSVSFAAALGLVCGPLQAAIDMTPAALLDNIKQKKKERFLWRATVVSWGVIFVLSFVLMSILEQNTQQSQRLRRTLALLSSDAAALRVSQKLAVFERHILREPSAQEKLSVLYETMPSSLDLTSCEIDQDGRMVLLGEGKDISAVFSFWKTLKEKSFFVNSRLVYVRQGRSGPQGQNVTFRIEN